MHSPKNSRLRPESIGPERKITSYRLDPLVARSFKESCRKVGQSTCGVLEPFMYAFTRAVSAGDYHDPRPMIVNLSIERRVQRIHRRGVIEELVEEREIQGDKQHCAWCGSKPDVEAWIRQNPYIVKQPYLCTPCLGYIRGRGVKVTWRHL